MTKRICMARCTVWSRVVGYCRPVSSWHKGKQAEYKDRKVFDVNKNKQERVEK